MRTTYTYSIIQIITTSNAIRLSHCRFQQLSGCIMKQGGSKKSFLIVCSFVIPLTTLLISDTLAMWVLVSEHEVPVLKLYKFESSIMLYMSRCFAGVSLIDGATLEFCKEFEDSSSILSRN